jgi:hypothetical protein
VSHNISYPQSMALSDHLEPIGAGEGISFAAGPSRRPGGAGGAGARSPRSDTPSFIKP